MAVVQVTTLGRSLEESLRGEKTAVFLLGVEAAMDLFFLTFFFFGGGCFKLLFVFCFLCFHRFVVSRTSFCCLARMDMLKYWVFLWF